MKGNLTYLVLAIATLSILIIGASGCGAPVYSGNNTSQANTQTQSNQVQATTVQTIGSVYLLAKNWNADPQVDGLEVDISPRDSGDSLVMTDGTVSVKLWKEVDVNYETKCLKRDQDLLDSWDGISVKSADYSPIGVTVRAEYKNYKVTDDKYAFGCADVVFTTPGGKTFTASQDSIFINGM